MIMILYIYYGVLNYYFLWWLRWRFWNFLHSLLLLFTLQWARLLLLVVASSRNICRSGSHTRLSACSLRASPQANNHHHHHLTYSPPRSPKQRFIKSIYVKNKFEKIKLKKNINYLTPWWPFTFVEYDESDDDSANHGNPRKRHCKVNRLVLTVVHLTTNRYYLHRYNTIIITMATIIATRL